MTASSPMKPLGKIGRFKFYRASRDHFVHPGVQVWTGSRHRRILPLPRRRRRR